MLERNALKQESKIQEPRHNTTHGTCINASIQFSLKAGTLYSITYIHIHIQPDHL